MKQLILSFFLILIYQFSTAQYIPFPQSDAAWSISVDVYTDPYANPYIESVEGYAHQMIGDSTINGIKYQKIFERPTWWRKTYNNQLPNGDYEITNEAGNYGTSTPVLLGLMRQDTIAKKIYFKRLGSTLCTEPSPIPIGEEVLLFDFDMAVGDTIYLGIDPVISHVIASIDSVQYNDGIYRKRYFPVESYPEFYFIEGIGASTGLFAGVRESFVEGEWCNLNCFAEAENYIIGNSIYNCDSITSITTPVVEIDGTHKIEIFPNPFEQYLQIDSKVDEIESLDIKIYNNFGQLVLRKMIASNQHYSLDLQAISNGIYFITISNNKGLLTTQKILKVD